MTAALLTARPTWEALEAHSQKLRGVHLRTLFAEDPERGERLTAEAAGVFLDYSKNRVTDETLALLLRLAEESRPARAHRRDVPRRRRSTSPEKRAVLHVALRAPRGASIVVDGENVVPPVHAVLDRMAEFADRVRSGAWKGHTGKRIRNVVNIGIGGSDLGPVMAYEALRALQRARPDVPLRLERRRHRLRRGRRATSTRRRRCSSSPRRPSRRSRR